MSAEHVMRWTYEAGYTKAEAVCLAAPDADCRLTPVSCECERWGEIRRDRDGIWHRIVEGSETEPQWHEVVASGECNVCLFINESGCAEEMTPDLERHYFTIADVPFEPVWESDGCTWRPLGVTR